MIKKEFKPKTYTDIIKFTLNEFESQAQRNYTPGHGKNLEEGVELRTTNYIPW